MSWQAFRATLPMTAGMVLLMLGIGNVWRGGGSSIIGDVFLIGGLVLTPLATKRQRAAAGDNAVPLGRHLLVLAAALALGTAIYLALYSSFDRT